MDFLPLWVQPQPNSQASLAVSLYGLFTMLVIVIAQTVTAWTQSCLGKIDRRLELAVETLDILFPGIDCFQLFVGLLLHNSVHLWPRYYQVPRSSSVWGAKTHKNQFGSTLEWTVYILITPQRTSLTQLPTFISSPGEIFDWNIWILR